MNDRLQEYNVIWDSPSRDSSGSMPLGNGDIGLNVWVEADGDLLLLIAKYDAWDENSISLKLGRIRIKLTPNPFKTGETFRQTLRLRTAEIEIVAASIRISESGSTRKPSPVIVASKPTATRHLKWKHRSRCGEPRRAKSKHRPATCSKIWLARMPTRIRTIVGPDQILERPAKFRHLVSPQRKAQVPIPTK